MTLRGKGQRGASKWRSRLPRRHGVLSKEAGGQIFLAASTDGSDGPTDAAGAFASAPLLGRARAAGLDPDAYLANNDSYAFFDKIGGLLRTGPTNTNVCDLKFSSSLGERPLEVFEHRAASFLQLFHRMPGSRRGRYPAAGISRGWAAPTSTRSQCRADVEQPPRELVGGRLAARGLASSSEGNS